MQGKRTGSLAILPTPQLIAAFILAASLPSMAWANAEPPPGWVIAEQPIPCGKLRGAYCFLDLEIDLREISRNEREALLAMKDEFEPDSDIVIVEPSACRRSKAAGVRLVKVARNVSFKGMKYDQLKLRLNREGCTLTVYFKPLPGLMGWFSGARPLFVYGRPCMRDRKCDGQPFAAYLPSNFRDMAVH